MTTKADFRAMVLRRLGVIDPTEDPDAEQQRAVDLWIDGARALLLEKGLCWWDADSIPTAVSVPLTTYVAALACGSFARAGKGFEAGEDVARRQIAALRSGEQREDVRADYF